MTRSLDSLDVQPLAGTENPSFLLVTGQPLYRFFAEAS
jgi:hypothetical protein